MTILSRLVPAVLLGLAACAAPPPPIVVTTPFGDVRAESTAKAEEVAELLEDLAPRVRAVLPGCQERGVDVWVQQELRVTRFHRRPQSVKGFTLLADEFEASRIHLQEQGQSAWYLAHELVHALVDESWGPLPGLLEEGLADVVAERLNPDHREHIRAHRLLNASAFTGGIDVKVKWRRSRRDAETRLRTWDRFESRRRLTTGVTRPVEGVEELLALTRAELHGDFREVPESWYGLAWYLVDRIVERRGLVGLHALCVEADAAGLDVVPAEHILEAAGLAPDELDAATLTTAFERPELHAAIRLRPDLFAGLLLDVLPDASPRSIYRRTPVFECVDDGGMRANWVPGFRERLYEVWRARREPTDVEER